MPKVPVKNSFIPDSLKETSLFKNHLLTTKNIDTKFHYTHYDYLPASILFISFLLLVWLYVSNFKQVNQVIKGFYLSRYANQLSRDEFSPGNRVTVFLTLLFVLTLSLFISQTLSYYGIGNFANNFSRLYLISTAAVTLIYLIKLITVSLTGFIFQAQKVSTDYVMTIFLYCNTLGLFMFPVVICLAFVRQVSPAVFIYAGIIMIALFISTRIFRGFIIWMNGLRGSTFYLFLYLCALEILPFFILYKLSTLLIK